MCSSASELCQGRGSSIKPLAVNKQFLPVYRAGRFWMIVMLGVERSGAEVVLLDQERAEMKCTTRRRSQDLTLERGQCQGNVPTEHISLGSACWPALCFQKRQSEVRTVLCAPLPNFSFLITSLVIAGADSQIDQREKPSKHWLRQQGGQYLPRGMINADIHWNMKLMFWGWCQMHPKYALQK